MSQRRAEPNSRNLPRQSRSRATVSAILDGMIRILDQDGFDAATTTRIAQVAGVSVGTLYQYFPNRDAILCALQDREFERATDMMQRVLTQAAGLSGREIARRIILGLLEIYALSPALHRVLVVEGLKVTPTDRVKAFDLRMVDTLRGFLSFAGLTLKRPDLGTAAFVAYHSVRACMLARLLEAPTGVTDAALVEELTDLVVGYLIEERQGD